MKKFIIVGGFVTSRSDGDRHFISARQLCELYGLNPDDCFLIREGDRGAMFGLPNLPWLYPRFKGDYRQHLLSIERREALH